ncbi:MAG: ribbon-helix-helix protein, CopG family [Giesbergeria sp.]|uniref:ribbon-helix-helix protein, CopG family n=1 Tax=Giesbergeria sp. TaxID=2818473 RepID=UPI002635A330|nr:ribbon-helix-helix protein, CopG family [Giesbergeria sp.]MDD2610951.1 ribbon-helix-helix protein, CopG family [Giesbergeria sp.]
MSIIKKPSIQELDRNIAAEMFISGAPDAAVALPVQQEETKKAPKRVRKGKKLQISLTISEPLLERVDALALSIGQSRAAVINLAILQALNVGVRIDGTNLHS